MSGDSKGAFTSLSDFSSKFTGLFQGPSFYSAFTNLDKKLRKKIMITVSITNNCSQ